MIAEYQDGLPFSGKGFGIKRNLYTSGRINMSVAEHGGIYRLGYLGKQKWNSFDLLKIEEASVFSQLFRLHVIINGTAYRMEFNNTIHFPFGYRSECKFGDVLIQHELIADNDTVFHRIKVLENPEGAKVTARVCQSFSAILHKEGRKRSEWVRNFDNGTLSATITDEEQETKILVGCAGLGVFKPITHQFKAYLLSAEPADEHLFYMTFNYDPERDLSSDRLDRKFAEYEELKKQGAHFKTGNPAYDSAIEFTPLLMHYLEIPGHPGAFRASPYYWVWGWDSMVHCESLIYAGYPEQVKRMLYFFLKAADPEYGILISYSTDLSAVRRKQPAPVQAFFLTTLYHYYIATGDEDTFQDMKPFAHLTAKKIAQSLVPGVNLIRERGYFPDYPHCIELTNHDFSAINNSVCHQGMRAWFELTGEFEKETRVLEKALHRFFDEKEGMWVDSLDGYTLEQRKYYPVYGQFYISPFAHEPHAEDHNRIGDFMKKNLLSRYGVWMFPPDRKGFMADGGQIGEYFPAIDRSYWNMMNAIGDSESSGDHERIVSAFWQNCTYPEGETSDVANVEPSLYEDDPGMKQLFTAKSWAASAVDLNLGLRWNSKGIELNPLPNARNFAIYDMRLRGKKISFVKDGKGRKAQYSYGNKTSETPFISWDELEDEMIIQIKMN